MVPHFKHSLTHELGLHGHGLKEEDLINGAIVDDENGVYDLNHGDVVIAAITFVQTPQTLVLCLQQDYSQEMQGIED